jgi:hypothetical protein
MTPEIAGDLNKLLILDFLFEIEKRTSQRLLLYIIKNC